MSVFIPADSKSFNLKEIGNTTCSYQKRLTLKPYIEVICDRLRSAIPSHHMETRVCRITCIFSKPRLRPHEKRTQFTMCVEQFTFYCSVFGTLDPLIWSHHANYRRDLYKMGGSKSKTTKNYRNKQQKLKYVLVYVSST